MIVGSAAFVPEEPHVPMHNMYRNNESVCPRSGMYSAYKETTINLLKTDR